MLKLITTLFVLMLAAPAQAAVVKVCFWSGGNSGEQGDRMLISATTRSVRVKTFFQGEEVSTATYQRRGEVKGQDGKTYLQYYVGVVDGATYLLVDESLLKAGTKGNAKLRTRGEGYYENRFFCRDDRQ
ncbi:MAG TPA: hypothetical protein VFV50_17590 [Bdellovibrionales bacterium]|nr:hypothetical protein [Bdellovibrionales bacterium]